MLLSSGRVSLRATDYEGKTPFIYVVAETHDRIVTLLIEHGASAKMIDHGRKRMLHHAIINDSSKLRCVETPVTPWHHTVRFGRTDIAEMLLLHAVSVDVAIQRRTWRHTMLDDRLSQTMR